MKKIEHTQNWRYIKPNGLKELWEKWAKDYIREYYKKKGINKRGQYRIFTQCATFFLDLLLERAVEHGEDIRIPSFGTICARQVKHTSFRGNRYGRNFEFCGGREYNIHDLMKKGNKYPVITFRNDGVTKSRSVYWKAYIKTRVKWRHRLYQKFYDEGFEYKNLRYLTEAEWKKKNNDRVIWRNGMVLKVKAKTDE